MTSNDAVAADELRITVEMGDDVTPSPELQSALDNLRAVLETESAEVAGFGFEPPDSTMGIFPSRSFSFSLNFEEIKVTYTENDSKGTKNT